MPAAALTTGMESPTRNVWARRFPDFGFALKSLLAFWALYLGLITLRSIVLQYPDFWEMLVRRSVVTLSGAALTILVYLAMRPLSAASLNRKAAVAGVLCLPASRSEPAGLR